MSAAELTTLSGAAAGGADQFFFQLYDGSDWRCKQAPNSNCLLRTKDDVEDDNGNIVKTIYYDAPHPILTEPLYQAWHKARWAKTGKHRFIGMLDATSGVDPAAVKAAVLRLCRDSRGDGVISLNAGTRGGLSGNFGRVQLRPIEAALKECVPALPK